MPLTNPPSTTDHSLLTNLTTGDPHTQYRLEADDHTHASSGAQGGQISHANLTNLTTGDPHTQYLQEADANWVDLTDGGATTLHTHANATVNFSTASQSVSANSVTYLTGSGILIGSAGLLAGQMYRWYIGVSKTAAGTGTPVWTPRIGTNQSTADTTVLTVTGTAQVATLSGTLIIVTCQIRTASATGVVVCSVNTGAASFGIGGSAVSGSFDTTGKAGQRFGLCVNTGASAAWTINSVEGELV